MNFIFFMNTKKILYQSERILKVLKQMLAFRSILVNLTKSKLNENKT